MALAFPAKNKGADASNKKTPPALNCTPKVKTGVQLNGVSSLCWGRFYAAIQRSIAAVAILCGTDWRIHPRLTFKEEWLTRFFIRPNLIHRRRIIQTTIEHHLRYTI